MSGWGAELVEPVTTVRDHLRGPEHATATLLEYGDYQCPYCGAAHLVVEAVLETLGRAVRFAYRHFPLTTIHPRALPAAQAAEAAGLQGQFWPMHDLLFQDQRHLERPDLLARARVLKLDGGAFAAALDSGEVAGRIQADFLSGVRSGVPGTPTFFVNGRRYVSEPTYDDLLGALQMALAA